MAQKSNGLDPGALQGVADDIRSSWEDDRQTPAIPRIPVPGPRRTDESPRVPQQPQRDLSGAVAA